MVALDFERIALRLDDGVGLELLQRHAVLFLEEAVTQLIAHQAAAQFMFCQPHQLLVGRAARLKKIQGGEQLIGYLHLQHCDSSFTNTFPAHYSVVSWNL